ncbi:J domain-containing protein [Phytoactinopolyspora alkaliphila]|uniref:J domain-containing protein n=1 Tax=Phytoactinopolyspora alkaliphila TaxID=1783498 RepID=A0A6N9YGC7_9ACTN|nr:J domain-containing protein [Phytoactinopolyspora alkaliphila]NED94053.1 J domain-containing protein [Phytoactinopolyspora alkaliphila]
MPIDQRAHGSREPHEILGVPRGAGPAQVTRAFRHKVLQGGHPDTGGDERTFRELARARDVLLSERPTIATSDPPPQQGPVPPDPPRGPMPTAPQRPTPGPRRGAGPFVFILLLYFLVLPVVARILMLLFVR